MINNKLLKSKLLNITDELKALKDTQKEILENIAKDNYTDIVKNKYSDIKDQEYYLNIYELAYDDETIEEILSTNPIALTYYQQNADTFDTLLSFALEMYHLSDNVKIEYLEDLEVTRIKVAKEKTILTTTDFEILYNYSKNQQANFRGRLNNPLPFRKNDSKSKSSNAKILYNADEVKQWFENNF